MLTADGTCSSDSVCKVISTCGPLEPDFGFVQTGLTLQFSDSSVGAESWQWKFGDGVTSTLQNPLHTYSSVGDYTICLTISDSCTTNQYCITVNICIPLVTADFTYSQSGISFQFTDLTATADGWLWDFGNGVTSTDQNPGYYYPGTGTYTVCLIASQQCDEDTFCQQVNAFENESVLECWMNTYDHPAAANDEAAQITLDSSANSYVAGGSGEEMVLVKYDTAGSLLWTSTYDSAGYLPTVWDMTIDAEGNNYLAVSMTGTSGNIDWLVLKYNNSGNLLWQSWYGSPSSSSADRIHSVELDKDGNVYAAGDSSSADLLLIKYDNAGNQLWKKRYNYEFEHDGMTDIKIDTAGNAYVSGDGTDNSGSATEGLLIKYNSQGVQQWVRVIDYDQWDHASQIFIDNDQNVYVSIDSYDGGVEDFTFASLYKFSPSNTALWEKHIETYAGSYLYLAETVDLGIDSADNVYWNVFFSPDDLSISDVNVTYKYSSAGSLLWSRTYTSALNVFFDNQEMIVAKDGSAYLTGSNFTSFLNSYSDSSRIETVKLDADGKPVWIRLFNNPLGDIPHALAVDENENVFVTGYTKTLSGNQFITIKYCNTCNGDVSLSLAQDTFCFGTPAVVLSGGFPSGGDYYGDGVSNNSFDPTAAGPGEHVIYYSFTDSNGCTATDEQTVFVDVCTQSEFEATGSDLNVFPNPFSNTATVHLSLDNSSNVKIDLMNAQGKKMRNIVEGNFGKGEVEFLLKKENLSPGIYFLRVQTPAIMENKKIIIQ